MNNRKPHICFVSPNAYGALTGGNSGHVGGVERQTSLMARWLAAQGYPVSMVTWDEGQEDNVKISGIRNIKMCGPDRGLPGLRFFLPRWSSLNAAMKRADADVYYQNCGECVTGQVGLWCRRYGRRFIYSVASDPDCDARLPEMHTLRERVLYQYGLKHADEVIVQTRRQREMLQKDFQRESVVLPMPCPGPSEKEYALCEGLRGETHRILWMGRVCEVKRPDRMLDLAEGCPDLSVDLVGPADGTEYSRQICERAKSVSNVVMHGTAPREKVSEFYRRAGILCCTSDFEGFPNTFLEAWSWGVPIVSTVDPDNLIAEKGLGSVGMDVSELEEGIRRLMNSPRLWMDISKSTREHYLQNYEVEKAMRQFEQVFCDSTNTVYSENDRDSN